MPQRIQLSRAKGWRKPEGAIVVTRATLFGNPWTVGDPARVNWPGTGAQWISDHFMPRGTMTADKAVWAYRFWLAGYSIPLEHRPAKLTRHGHREFRAAMATRHAAIMRRLPDLRGHDLCCFCPLDQPCHADVLLDLANREQDR